MASKNLRSIDETNFDAEVLGADRPYVVEFGATWCGPCRVLLPLLDKLAGEHAGRVHVGAIDVDDSPGLAARYAIRGAPTIVVFERGKEVRRQLGLTSEGNLRRLFAIEGSAAHATP